MVSDYASLLDTIKALISSFTSVILGYFNALFRMNYFGLNLGKLLFAFLLLSIVFNVVFNALHGGKN